MKPYAHPIDPQLQLSVLFLALSEARQEAQRTAAPQGTDDPAIRLHEPINEDPERWDGLW